ncbi:MAG: RNA methyltransferase [Prevotella sp.]|nr:RNA methyltransferase [Prevotella sp.]
MRKLNILEMNRLTVDEFREADKLPLVVVLDDVRSLYNVGSVFRTCDAFRVEAVYLCGITATPPHNEIHKTALGAEDSVAWRYFKTADEAVAELKRQNFTVYAVEQAEGSVKLPFSIENPSSKLEKSPSLPLHSPFSPLSLSSKTALILGHEVKGVSQSVVDACDGCLEIPQFGTKHSLNVSVAAGIVIWEFARHFYGQNPEKID